MDGEDRPTTGYCTSGLGNTVPTMTLADLRTATRTLPFGSCSTAALRSSRPVSSWTWIVVRCHDVTHAMSHVTLVFTVLCFIKYDV